MRELRWMAATTLALALALALGGMACDRNLEPFDPDVEAERPDLSKIFPEPPDEAPPAAAPSDPIGRGGRGAPPVTSPTAAPTNAAGSAIRGSVEVAPQLAQGAPSGATLFVIARPAGTRGGPPLAVKRIADAQLPIEFEIGPADVMIPSMRFEGSIDLTARLDSDGSATTRTPGDIQGSAATVATPGSDSILIVLDEAL